MWPTISVIIPSRPGEHVGALRALQAADYPAGRLEVLIQEGRCPPRQRNEAARRAGGDVLYFLDDDSLVAADALQRLASHYLTPEVHAVGGPSITPRDASPFCRGVGYALGMRLGAWAMSARYAPIGRCRRATEKELIGCNLSVRRDAFEAVGGFREDLFPNEETELVSRLLRAGHNALYDPDVVVWRAQRPSLPDLARQFIAYGRGRMRQIVRTHPADGLLFVTPAVGLLYLLLLPALWVVLGRWATLPAAAYGLLLLAAAVAASLRHRTLAGGLLLPLLLAVIHGSYALGLAYELLSRGTGRGESSASNRSVGL